MPSFVRYYVGDVVRLKKKHPCGSDLWEVQRTGVDFVIQCHGCNHQVMLQRPVFQKAVKKLVSRQVEESPDNT